MSCLIDVNVWFALAVRNHAHHARVNNWFDAVSAHSAAFCRVTQAGFLRLLTNSAAMKGNALSTKQAWSTYQALRDDERVYFATEPSGIEPLWVEYTTRVWPFPSRWTDCYLAAFARRADITLITFDAGFLQAPGLRSEVLSN